MKKLLFSYLLFVSMFSFSQNENTITPTITIKIPLGETITIENHQLKFVKVLEDSRCPEGTTCIWAGRAKVLVEILEEGKEPLQKELIFGKVNQGESKDLTLFSTSETNVSGYTLKPYPASTNSSREKDYVLLILANKME